VKKTILSLIVASSISFAGDYSFEATIAGGKTHFAPKIADDGLKATRTIHFGWQFNELDFPIKPQLALDMTSGSHYKPNSPLRTRSNKVFLNGLYEFENMGVIPYFLAGIGREDVKNEHHQNFNDSNLFNLGVGIKIPLFDVFSFKLEGRYIKRLDNGKEYEKVLLAGLNIGFGRKITYEEPSKPISIDDDNDGVSNRNDQCPHTKLGVIVDLTGCKKVVKKIIPKVVADDDNDGVTNKFDQCPNTPKGTHIDISGCEVKRVELKKKIEIKVYDQDNDGIADSVDSCPNSAPNAKVDSKGCIEVIKIKDVRFKSGSARINQQYLNDLNKVIRYLNENPQIRIEVAGHTDSRGSRKYNQKLSQRRADSVKRYLFSKGISNNRVSSAGYGESRPIASNKTAKGRAKNRRIEAEVYIK